MQFREDKTDQFLQIFKNSHELIKGSEGCISLKLVRGTQSKNIFYTISEWKSELFLDKYRNSTLFKETWNKTKILFIERAEAISTELCHFGTDTI